MKISAVFLALGPTKFISRDEDERQINKHNTYFGDDLQMQELGTCAWMEGCERPSRGYFPSQDSARQARSNSLPLAATELAQDGMRVT